MVCTSRLVRSRQPATISRFYGGRGGIHDSSAGLIADEVRERERYAELQCALGDAAAEDLFGLIDSVGDRVLVDAEAFGGAAAA